MRVVFAGATQLAVQAARLLIERGDELVIIEADKSKIEKLSDEIDCGFLHGDAGKPEVLREAAPERTDVLFCLSDDDRVNIIASLIARSLKFERVVTKIEDEESEEICLELGLKDTIIPSRTIGRFLADFVRGPQILELSTFIKGEARFFSFKVGPDDVGQAIKDFDLPDDARVICYYRDEHFHLSEPDSKLKKDDEVVILTHSRNLEELRERWAPETRGEGPSEETVHEQQDH